MSGRPSSRQILRRSGAQERSRDETAPRRAPSRASLDGSEHRGIDTAQSDHLTKWGKFNRHFWGKFSRY